MTGLDREAGPPSGLSTASGLEGGEGVGAAGDARSAELRRVTGLTDLETVPVTVTATTFEELLTAWDLSLREV